MKNFLILFIFLLTFLISRSVFSFVSVNNLYGDFISFPDSNFYCAYLMLNNKEGKVVNFFVIHTDSDKNYLISPENFISASRYNVYYPLMKMDFSFLEFKENVKPYLHPNFVIKFLFLLNKLNHNIRISDAMRSPKEQMTYKRRGWTDVLVSPHMIGLAADLSYYTGSDREILLKCYQPLNIRSFEHGGKYTRHIHLQDNEVWKPIKKANEEILLSASDELNEEIFNNSNILKLSAIEFARVKHCFGFDYEFFSDGLNLLKMKIENNIGEEQAMIITGVFETGNHNVSVKYDFLRKGVYKVKFFLNNFFVEEKCIVRY